MRCPAFWRGGVPAPGGRYEAHPDPGLYRRAERGRAGRGRHQPDGVLAEYMRALSEAALRAGVAVRVHLKVDTGMGRIGFTADDDMERAVAEMAEPVRCRGLCPWVSLRISQRRTAPRRRISPTRRQYDILCAAVEEMAARGCTFAVKHCCNSAGTFAWPEFHLDMVRPGIILYGEQPRPGIRCCPGLCPRWCLRAAVSMVKELAAGDAVATAAPSARQSPCVRPRWPWAMRTVIRGRCRAGARSRHGRPARVLGRGVWTRSLWT